MSQTLPSSLVAQTQPAPETFGVALVLGVIIGAGMAYHAHSNGRSGVVWGLVGFVLGIIGLLIYLGYLVFGPSAEEEKPGPDVAGPASGPAETRTQSASTTGVPEPENRGGALSDSDNQWRQVASEVRGSDPGHQPRATERRGASAGSRLAVELTYGDGQSDLLSGVTQVERDGRALVVTRGDGTETRYENGRVERVWDGRDE
ncbi:MAG: hypothetical protein V5A55_05395 [Halovenus sp.]